MEKSICAFIFAITFITLSGVVHGQPTRASRGPSVEPIVEVDIEDVKKAETANTGYNFSSAERAPSAAKSRVPPNIVSKTHTTTPSSYIGPLILLFALPFALWIMVSKNIYI